MAIKNLLLTLMELKESYIPGEGFQGTLISQALHTHTL